MIDEVFWQRRMSATPQWPRRCPAVYAEGITAWPSCYRGHWELDPLRRHIDRAHSGYQLTGWRHPEDPG